VIAFLRFIGLMNAALWLGAVVFHSVVVGPACTSVAMEQLLGAKNFPYFSGAFADVVTSRYFLFLGGTGSIALLHLLAEWVYMGRPTRKLSLALLGGLLGLVLLGGVWLVPHLQALHARRYAPNSSMADRTAAAQSFRFWHVGLLTLNVAMIGGLVVYVWRVANPADAPRFISSVKFRG
jgi:hypothetical protein